MATSVRWRIKPYPKETLLSSPVQIFGPFIVALILHGVVNKIKGRRKGSAEYKS